jgi:hypothetical protein
MELLDEAHMSTLTPIHITELLKRALDFEKAAADSVVQLIELEPTRSVLHRSAANLALRVGDHATALQYVEIGLQGHPPTEIRIELQTIRDQALVSQARAADKATIPVDIASQFWPVARGVIFATLLLLVVNEVFVLLGTVGLQ